MEIAKLFVNFKIEAIDCPNLTITNLDSPELNKELMTQIQFMSFANTP